MIDADLFAIAVCLIMFSATIYCVRQAEFTWKSYKKDREEKQKDLFKQAEDLAKENEDVRRT